MKSRKQAETNFCCLTKGFGLYMLASFFSLKKSSHCLSSSSLSFSRSSSNSSGCFAAFFWAFHIFYVSVRGHSRACVLVPSATKHDYLERFLLLLEFFDFIFEFCCLLLKRCLGLFEIVLPICQSLPLLWVARFRARRNLIDSRCCRYCRYCGN